MQISHGGGRGGGGLESGAMQWAPLSISGFVRGIRVSWKVLLWVKMSGRVIIVRVEENREGE